MNTLRRITIAATLAAALLVPSAASGSQVSASPVSRPVHHSAKFQMPSGNIACLFNSGKLRCDILSGLKPEPQKSCDFFWKGVMLSARGKASYLCIIDTVYDPKAPTLRYGTTWKRDGIVCRSRTTGLRCHNPAGHGFRLSRHHSTKW